MKDDKIKGLSGLQNKRLMSTECRNNENTFPLVDTAYEMNNSHLTIPPEEDIVHAKEWVDDGSRL